MKTIGVVGGTGPDSTAEYYRAFIAASRERYGRAIPRILINSVDSDRAEHMFGLVGAGRHEELADTLLSEVALLSDAGAELVLIASNTLHVVFELVAARSAVPLVSIVEATATAVETMGLRRLGLFATSFTVAADLFRPALGRRGIEVVHPRPAEQERIHGIYVDELLHARFEPESRDALLAIADRMRQKDRLDGMILGGTELPLLLRDQELHGMRFLDSGRIHVAAALAAAAGQDVSVLPPPVGR